MNRNRINLKLWHKIRDKRRLARDKDVQEEQRMMEEIIPKLAEPAPAPEHLKDKILQEAKETPQEHLRAKAIVAKKRSEHWLWARPLWQFAIVIAAAFAFIFRRKK